MVVSFPESTLFSFGSKSSSGSNFFSLLFFKESLLRGEFRFSLLEVGGSSSVGSRKHISGGLEIVDETEESSLGGLLVGGVLNKRGLKGLKETLHFVNDDSQSVTINSRSNFQNRSDRVRFTNLSQLSESGGSGLWAKRLKSWNNHLKSFNSLFSFSASSDECGGISSSIGSNLNIMSSN